MKNLLNDARENKYAIVGFNIHDLIDSRAIVVAAWEKKSPVYLMTTEAITKYLGIKYIVDYVKRLKEDYDIPMFLHLDHGRDMELAKECINAGYDSIMYDGSLLSFQKNISRCHELSKMCHDKGILIEGELGKIKGVEEDISNDHDLLTNPDLLEEFVEKSNLDSVAVSIGNAHGLYKSKPKIDFQRLYQLNNNSEVPLVLHGGTGIPFNDIQRAISMGIAKLNVGTQMHLTYKKAVESYLIKNNEFKTHGLTKHIIENIKELTSTYIELVGSKRKIRL